MRNDKNAFMNACDNNEIIVRIQEFLRNYSVYL